jgi:hypothetical protein
VAELVAELAAELAAELGGGQRWEDDLSDRPRVRTGRRPGPTQKNLACASQRVLYF